MLRRWRIACAAGMLAAAIVVRFAFVTRTHVIDVRSNAVVEASTTEFATCSIPDAWAEYPIVAHLDLAHAESSITGRGMFNDVHVTTAPLGDVFVRYEWDQCTAGGSSCAGVPHTLYHIRFGPLDDRGEPKLMTDFRCTGTSPFDEGTRTRHSCDPATIALRRAPNGSTFVVTMRDPDAEEKPIAAFTRTPPAP
jgi:hypothetical protein